MICKFLATVAFSHVFYARVFDTWLSMEVEQYLAIVRVPVREGQTEKEIEIVRGRERERDSEGGHVLVIDSCLKE